MFTVRQNVSSKYRSREGGWGHSLFSSSFRCATFNFHSFIHSHPNIVYFPISFRCATFNFHSFIHSHPNIVYFPISFRCATFNFHSFIHSHPNTVYFPLRSAALLSIFILSFILIPTQFIFLFVPLRYFQFSFFHSFSSQHSLFSHFVPLRYFQFSFFHSFSSQHSLFSSSFRCATFNFHSFIHSHPNIVYFPFRSAAPLSTFLLSFILIPTLFIFLFLPLRYFQLSFFHSFSSRSRSSSCLDRSVCNFLRR